MSRSLGFGPPGRRRLGPEIISISNHSTPEEKITGQLVIAPASSTLAIGVSIDIWPLYDRRNSAGSLERHDMYTGSYLGTKLERKNRKTKTKS